MQFLSCISTLILLGSSRSSAFATSPGCKCFPGDECWPTQAGWDNYNSTVSGRLIATTPLGSPCHDPDYNEELCTSLQSQWLQPGIHMESSSSVMDPVFANQSCDPWQPRARPCVFGNYVRYSVNATGAKDVIASISFAKKHNLRFVIRNTGHDYLGRSTGAGALAIWTHYLKGVEPLDWDDPSYQGKALRFGAGVLGFEALEEASALGLVIITGECPTVGLAGGYTQGGGHSALSTNFGLAADNTLSFEVVTASGELLTASRTQNSDLYWALSGGGPGNFGVVVSMTVKAHPEAVVSGIRFSVTAGEAQAAEKVFDAVDAFHETITDIVDAGIMVIYFFGTGFFQIPVLTAYNKTEDELKQVLAPFFSRLDALRLEYTMTYTEFSSYYEHYNHYLGPLPLGNIGVGTSQYGSRLILRSQITSFGDTARALADNGAVFIGVGTNVSRFGGDNSVLPAWRDTIVHGSLDLPFNFTAPWADTLATRAKITDNLVPLLEKATPGSGAYMNEADWQQPGFQDAFFGSNYAPLRAIKKKWDPEGFFYAVGAVGSEAFTVREDGRLCLRSDSDRIKHEEL
ncbi:hypothetical protein BX600DRAFT_417740 [Xylariales sp. PMI_506]|nr:hypothetical protein BX600DRAFT_417740 [Xylariales sp. PMI_506]